MINHPMKRSIRILHLEDLAMDAELVEWKLRKGNFDFELLVVDNRDTYMTALHSFAPDVIISDHSLPNFNSIEALKLKKEWNPDIPFILVTSTVSEEFAVNAMKEGASDYILKDRMERLPASVINCFEKFTAEQEKIKAQQLLLESEANLKAILDNTDNGYILISPELKIASFNQRAVLLTKYQFNQPIIVGAFALDFLPDDRKPLVGELLNKAILGEKIEYEVSYLQPDGSYRWFFITYAGISNLRDEIIGVIMSITDINSRKLAEIEKDRVTSDLIKRNISMEQFSYIVSHNLRAPVSSILGLEYLLREGGLNEKESKEVHIALTQATSNLDTIVKDLNEILRVTQHESEQLSEVLLPQMIESIRLAIAPTIKKEGAILTCDFTLVDSVKAVRSNLYSIFYNLVLNGIKFHRDGIPPVISIQGEREANRLLLYVRDNGQGIDLDKHEKSLFGLYNTFNSTSSGRGMGLFMVKAQVDRLNGSIKVSSKVGEGTEFLISIPVTDADGA